MVKVSVMGSTGVIGKNVTFKLARADTISEVVYQMEPTLQYACVENGQLSDAICMYESGELSEEDFEIAEIVYENVEYVLTENLEGNPLLPESVIYQSEFKQGTDVYDKIGNTYFCYE